MIRFPDSPSVTRDPSRTPGAVRSSGALRRAALAALASLTLGACGGEPEQGIARGEALFDTCVPCHGADGAGNAALAAPAIAGLPQWYLEAQLENFQNARRGGHPQDTAGIRMKSMSWALDLEGDVQSVAEYVASMPPVAALNTLEGGDPAAGQASFQTCVACHGADGKGNEMMHGPPLVGQADWYLLAQLRKFKDGWRGTDPQDTWGATMRPNAMLLDEAAMENVVAYIRTLR